MNKLWINLKSWYGVLVLVLLAGGGFWFFLNGMPYINSLRSKWEAQRLQDQWEKPYREDKYGGKTPEETYDLFITALKNNNAELSSKYFSVDRQKEWLKTLTEYKNKNLLANFAQELEEKKKSWTITEKSEEKTVFTYTYVVKSPYVEKLPLGNGKFQELTHPTGKFKADTIFNKNTLTNIWKIYVL